jgi:hypothetical protein
MNHYARNVSYPGGKHAYDCHLQTLHPSARRAKLGGIRQYSLQRDPGAFCLSTAVSFRRFYAQWRSWRCRACQCQTVPSCAMTRSSRSIYSFFRVHTQTTGTISSALLNMTSETAMLVVPGQRV